MIYNAPFGSADPTAGFLNGNPSAGIAGSIPPAAALEQTQREIVACIAAAGLTPNPLDLTQLMQAVRGGALSYIGDAGTANVLLVNPNPAYINYFVGMTLSVKPAYGNTGPSTINVNSLSPVPIVKKAGTALSGGEWSQGDIIQLQYNGTAFQIIGGGASSGGSSYNSWVRSTAGTYPYVVPKGVSYILASVWGGGGAGAGVSSSSGAYNTPCGGGGGGFALDLLNVTGGQQINAIVGAGAPRTAAGQYAGTAGGTSSFGALVATGGSGASLTVGPTPGGIGSGGSLNLNGGVGRGGFAAGSANTPCGGDGGSSWCSGPVPFSQGAQHDGEQTGQGGSGASTLNNSNVAGGAGHAGMITVVCVG